MAARFTASEAEAIDKARGDTDRSVWLRSAALDALERQSPQPGTLPGMKVIVNDRMPPGLIAVVSPGPDGPSAVTARIAKPEPCPHRLPSGAFCKACGTART
jgi:hypothetical protein